MQVKDLFVELQENDAYKVFLGDFPDAFLSAGFFILDFVAGTENLQLDFFIPSLSRVAGFEFPFREVKVFDDEMKVMSPLILELKVDLDDMRGVCEDIIHQHNSAMRIAKMILVLRDGVWNCTCMDDMLGIIRIKVDALTGKEVSFDKGSIMDIARVVKK